MKALLLLLAQYPIDTPDLFNGSSAGFAFTIALYFVGIRIVIGSYALSPYLMGRILAKAGVAP